MNVRPITSEDVAPLAGMLGRAFDDDPVFRAIVPDDRHRRRALPELFRQWTILLHLPLGGSYTTDDHAGAALWSPPGHWGIGWLMLARMGPTMMRALGLRTAAALRVLHAIEAPHPRTPHHYLRVLGCDPSRQGQGLGSKLLEPALAQCDARGEAAYLESSNERNLTFYRRHGFELRGEVVTHLGAKAWLMWRDPR
jgi:ribosomal protein S18 acetylase RimI-like enzyme